MTKINIPDKATRESWTLFQQVARYNEEFDSPTLKSDGYKALELGGNLIVEEVVHELLPALAAYQANPSLENLDPVCDGIIDGVVVLLFLAHQFGLPFDKMWNKVQDTQWAKVWEDGLVHRQGPGEPKPGKIIKPPGWQEPNFMQDLIEWNTKNRGESYVGGLIRHENEEDKPSVRET